MDVESKEMVRLHVEILAVMPPAWGERVGSGVIIAVVEKDGTSRDRTWWRTERRLPAVAARRPPVDWPLRC